MGAPSDPDGTGVDQPTTSSTNDWYPEIKSEARRAVDDLLQRHQTAAT